jgi:hypothetical protein
MRDEKDAAHALRAPPSARLETHKTRQLGSVGKRSPPAIWLAECLFAPPVYRRRVKRAAQGLNDRFMGKIPGNQAQRRKTRVGEA